MFREFPNVVAVVSEKSDGDCARPWNAGDEKEAERNRARFLRARHIDPSRVVVADLVHGRAVKELLRKDRGARILETDGLCTKESGVFLSITVADCLPVFFYDPFQNVVGLVHAGWRGLARGILMEVVEKLEGMGCSPKNVYVGVGPGIGVCHYEVGEDVSPQFSGIEGALVERDEATFLDLKCVAREQLQTQGIDLTHIEISPDCTFCEKERYFSYRRDRPKVTKAMMAVCGIRRSS